MTKGLTRAVTALDLTALTFAVGIASWVVLDSVLPWRSDIAIGSTLPMLAALYGGAALGELLARQLWQTSVQRPSYARAVLVAATSVGAVAIIALATRVYWSRPFLILTAAIWLTLMVLFRAVWRSRAWEERYVAITSRKHLADDLNASPNATVVATVQPNQACDLPPPGANGATLLVDPGSVLSDDVSRYVAAARAEGTAVRSFVDVYEEHTGRASIAHVPDGWSGPGAIRTKSGYLPIKRALDIVGSILLSPFAAVAVGIGAIWVKLDSPGPALFHQQRVGENGRVFTIHKIRTMYDYDTETGARFVVDEDARVTKAGRRLRRLRIDELPQLWNVIRGDLSLVGPRPEQVGFVAEFEREIPFYSERLLVRPGITGWAQVHHGYASSVDETIEKLAYDLYYVKHMSFWLDLRVLGRSVWTVITGFGAK